MSEILGSLVGTAGAMINNAINQRNQDSINSRNERNQMMWNQTMLNQSRNAYTWATADRLRAGLSPLDSQQAETPALTSPDMKAFRQDNPLATFSQDVSNAMNFQEQRRLNNASIAAMNAQTAKIDAETQEKLLDIQEQASTIEKKIESLNSQYDNIKDKGSSEAESLKKQIEIQEREKKKMDDQIKLLEQEIERNKQQMDYFNSLGMPFGGADAGLGWIGNSLLGGKHLLDNQILDYIDKIGEAKKWTKEKINEFKNSWKEGIERIRKNAEKNNKRR